MNRQGAYAQFERFAENAETVFNEFVSNDARAIKLSQEYSFYAVKGGANGGIDKRIVEIFFGARPFDEVTMLSDNGKGFPAPRTTLLSERGACLRYERMDNGFVLCTLYPATTNNLRHVEDFILLEKIDNPSKLNFKRTISVHWRKFISYMEYTNIETSPHILDRLRVWWLRFTKPLSVDGRIRNRKVFVVFGKIFGYAITVGLSGFLLAIVNYYIDNKEIETIRNEQIQYIKDIKYANERIDDQKNQIQNLVDERSQLTQDIRYIHGKIDAQLHQIDNIEKRMREFHRQILSSISCVCSETKNKKTIEKK